ncbi:tripartite motif-containing protein 16-like [Salvelinus fontinalis]|uniref:tripartite motif-containing protein 16-like n=1 Tax=Salvelinus fontinalis TaxID=8038 RepID=UPI0024863C79|nr:tripartite motif-containing protein 16-like [Salvelinus fontinalis]
MAQQGVLLDQDQFCCSVCLDLLKEPVTSPCGHSYCRSCIEGCWDQDVLKGVYSCPQCRETFTPRPNLRKNNMLAEVVEKLKKTGLQAAPPPALCYAGPGDVACDVCTETRKQKALMSCLVCLASYCETHLQPHYESPAFKKHKLVKATTQLQEKICSHHDKLLEVFCRTDQQCICYLCTMDEHKGHDTVSAAAERTEKQRQLGMSQQKVQQRFQEREKELKELQQAVESFKVSLVDQRRHHFTFLLQSEREREGPLSNPTDPTVGNPFQRIDFLISGGMSKIYGLESVMGEVQEALPDPVRRGLEQPEEGQPPFPPLQVTAETGDGQESPENLLTFNTLSLGAFSEVGGKVLYTLSVKVKHIRSLAGVKGHQWQGVVGAESMAGYRWRVLYKLPVLERRYGGSGGLSVRLERRGWMYEKAQVSQAEGLLDQLKQEIAELRKRSTELEQLSHTEDHIHFLQSYQSLSSISVSSDLASIVVRPPQYFGYVSKTVSELREKLEDFLKGEWTKISTTVNIVEVVLPPEPKTREELLQYSCQLTLDPNTACTHLSLSEGNRKVTTTRQVLPYPDHPDRFTNQCQVLCREGLSGGCYWEVEWSGVYVITTVSYKDISRTERDNIFGFNNKSWSLQCYNGCYWFRHNNVKTKVSGPQSSRVGVYLDHKAGTLSFYSVSDTMTLLHRVQTTFTQPLYAGFNLIGTAELVKL